MLTYRNNYTTLSQGIDIIKINCWEFKKCGREPGGTYAHELGICPASIEIRLDGTHHGINAGRCCWIVEATICEGKKQGAFPQKYKDCKKCAFFKKVSEEENNELQNTESLLFKLKKI